MCVCIHILIIYCLLLDKIVMYVCILRNSSVSTVVAVSAVTLLLFHHLPLLSFEEGEQDPSNNGKMSLSLKRYAPIDTAEKESESSSIL